MKIYVFIHYYLVLQIVHGINQYKINFVKKYILNERRPTVLLSNYLCWSKDEQIDLFKSLSESGIRASSVYNEKSLAENHHTLFLVDLTCSRIQSLMNGSNFLQSPYRWLVMVDTVEKHIHTYLWQIPLPINIDFVVAERDSHETFVLTEIYKPFPNAPTQTKPWGYFNGSLVETRTNRELFRRRNNVMGHALTMSNVIQDSNTTMYHLPKEDRLLLQYDAHAKLNWIAFRMVADMINATPRYIFNTRFGYFDNGVMTGMIKDIADGKADLGSNCYPNKDRMKIATFTDCIARLEVKFIFRQPPLSYICNIFTLPFSFNVWLAILLFVIISSIVVYVARKWEAYLYKDQAQHNIADVVFFAVSALSQQSCFTEAKKLSGRLVIWLIFLAMMSLYTAYSANILVLLQSPSTSIKTLEHLRNSKMTIAALDIDYNYFVLKDHKDDPVRKSIYKKIVPDVGKPQFYDFVECVEKLRKGFFAVHAILDTLYRYIDRHFLESEKCGITTISYIVGSDAYIPINKFSQYLELLRVGFKRVRETGMSYILEKRYLQAKPRCTNQSSFSSVGLIDMRPVLILMMFGFLASIAVWIVEIVVIKITTRS